MKDVKNQRMLNVIYLNSMRVPKLIEVQILSTGSSSVRINNIELPDSVFIYPGIRKFVFVAQINCTYEILGNGEILLWKESGEPKTIKEILNHVRCGDLSIKDAEEMIKELKI